MKKIYLISLIVNLITITGFAQDKIIKTDKDTIECQIREIGDDEIKYILNDFRGDILFGIDKNKVSRIIFSDGKELTFMNSMYDPAQYAKQHKNALKIGFLSPLFGATSFSYERSLKPGSSLEATLGIIGLGTDIAVDNANGLYLKFGYKFIKSPDFYLKGMRYAHILKGAYIRPEVSFASYSFEPVLDYFNGNTLTHSSRQNNTMFAVMINFGKQWVMQDRFLIDWFTGVGYGFGNSKDHEGFHYAFTGGVDEFPMALTSGIRIGFLF